MGRQIFWPIACLVVSIALVQASAIDKPVATKGVQLTANQRVEMMTDFLIEYKKTRETRAAFEPVNCEVLYDMLQAAQAVYLEQCPGV